MLPLLTVSLILCLISISDTKWAKKYHNKCRMILSSQNSDWQPRPWCHVSFVKNERLECEIKASLGYYSAFYQHHTQKLYQSSSYPYVGVIFDKYILSRSHILADSDPTGTLDLCAGAQSKQKNTQNTMIEAEIITLST